MRASSTALVILALAAVSCDTPWGESAPSEETLARIHLEASIQDCIADCDEDANLSRTNRATCRLTCEARRPTEPVDKRPPGSEPLMVQFNGCDGACDGDASPTDRATCRLQCKQTIAGDDACRAPCLDRMLGCQSGCEDQEQSSDRATCRLHCENNSSLCLARCS